MDPQNTSSMVYLGLCLVETALEVGADHLAKYPSFLQLVKDPLCRNLLSVSNVIAHSKSAHIYICIMFGFAMIWFDVLSYKICVLFSALEL